MLAQNIPNKDILDMFRFDFTPSRLFYDTFRGAKNQTDCTKNSPLLQCKYAHLFLGNITGWIKNTQYWIKSIAARY